MLKVGLGVGAVCLLGGLCAQVDTVLLKQIALPYSVRSVASDDQGVVEASTARGRERWNGEAFEVVDDGDFAAITRFEGQIRKQIELHDSLGDWDRVLAEEWRPHLPHSTSSITACPVGGDRWWVSNGQSLFEFEVAVPAEVRLMGNSIRGLRYADDFWVAQTYSGLYINGEPTCPELEFSNGQSLVFKDTLYAFGYSMGRLAVRDLGACILDSAAFDDVAGKWVTFASGAVWQNELWIGNNKGLARWQGGRLRYVLEGHSVDRIRAVDSGLFLMSDDGGVWFWDGSAMQATELEVNVWWMEAWTEGRWLLATDMGLGIWSPDRHVVDFITRRDGLRSNAVCAVHVDDWGTVWFSTFSGVHRYVEGLGVIEVHHPYVEFNRGSFGKGRDGVLHFGSVDGIHDVVPTPFKADTNSAMIWWGFGLLWIGVAAGLVHWLRKRKREQRIAWSHEQEAFRRQVERAILSSLPHASVAMLADQMGCSERQFYRRSSDFGIRPGELIRTVKLNTAWALLQQHGESMKTVAEQIGYSPNHLRRLLASEGLQPESDA